MSSVESLHVELTECTSHVLDLVVSEDDSLRRQDGTDVGAWVVLVEEESTRVEKFHVSDKLD